MSFNVVINTSKDYLDNDSLGYATSDSDTLFANYAGGGVRQIGGNGGGPRRTFTSNTATTSTSPSKNDDTALGHSPLGDNGWQDTSQLAPEVEEMINEILTSKPVNPTMMDEMSEISRPSKIFRPDDDDDDSSVTTDIYTKKLKMS